MNALLLLLTRRGRNPGLAECDDTRGANCLLRTRRTDEVAGGYCESSTTSI